MALASRAVIGSLLAVSAFTLWGLFPIYWKQLVDVNSVEVLAHRIVWSFPFVVIILLAQGRVRSLLVIFKSRIQLAQLAITATLISLNWGIYIWAMGQNKIVEASMGYFLSPIMSIALGLIVFKERLLPLQWLAIFIAATGVCYMFVVNNTLPWIALALGSTFALYGGLRKKINIDSVSGLCIETLLVTPFALTWIAYLQTKESLVFSYVSWSTDLLLIGGGVVTALPLLLFVASTKHLSLSSVGLLFYLTPTIQFLIGWLFYAEPLTQSDLVTFLCIWIALILFAWQSFHLKTDSPRS